MKNVVILGATGTLGSRLTKRLMQTGHYQLTLVSRHASGVFTDKENIRAIDCDATSGDALAGILPGNDVVVCAISGEQLPKVAQALTHAMKKAWVKRLVFMGAVGIYNEIPDEIDGEDNVANNPDQIPNRDAVGIIEKSDLVYTILRPGYLKDDVGGDMAVTRKGEAAKGYETSIPALVELICSIIGNDSLYAGESISYTNDMTR